MVPPHPLRILLVDDDEVDRMAVLRDLERAGMDAEVQVAVDGIDALETLERIPTPDVILLDLNMPRLGGLEFLARLRADTERGRVPVVVLTTSDNPEDRRAAEALAAERYLVKGAADAGRIAEVLAEVGDAAG